jgi:hypothetical protein
MRFASRIPSADSKAGAELQRRICAAAVLELGEESVLVRKAEREKASGMDARVCVLSKQNDGRATALKETPSGAADLDVIEKFEIDGRERKVAAKAAIDPGPETEVSEQLAGLEVRADKRLFGIDGCPALKANALRVGRRGYQEQDSHRGKNGRESSCWEDKAEHVRQGQQQVCHRGDGSRRFRQAQPT